MGLPADITPFTMIPVALKLIGASPKISEEPKGIVTLPKTVAASTEHEDSSTFLFEGRLKEEPAAGSSPPGQIEGSCQLKRLAPK